MTALVRTKAPFEGPIRPPSYLFLMFGRRGKLVLGFALLSAAVLSAGAVLASGSRPFNLPAPGHRSVLTLSNGVFSLTVLMDPSATFISDAPLVGPKRDRWRLQWLVTAPPPNPSAQAPGGWGVRSFLHLAWFADNRTVRMAAVVAWPIPALLAAAGAYLVLRNRHRRGTCPRCGYDLSTLPPGAPCPECGPSEPEAPASGA